MSHSPDQVKDCLTFGHIYTSTTTMRCPHREGWFVRACAWEDSPDGTTRTLFEEVLEFGPFDDPKFIELTVSDLTQKAVEAARHCKPSPRR